MPSVWEAQGQVVVLHQPVCSVSSCAISLAMGMAGICFVLAGVRNNIVRVVMMIALDGCYHSGTTKQQTSALKLPQIYSPTRHPPSTTVFPQTTRAQTLRVLVASRWAVVTSRAFGKTRVNRALHKNPNPDLLSLPKLHQVRTHPRTRHCSPPPRCSIR